MSADEKLVFARRFAVHVGVDTGKVFHKLVVRGPDGRRKAPYKVVVGREGFEAAHAWQAPIACTTRYESAFTCVLLI